MAQNRHRLRFELILGSLLLAFGLFAMPAMVYGVGVLLLGPYGERAHAGRFYGDFLGDLAAGSPRAWLLLLGPLIMISLIRLIFLRRSEPDSQAPTAEAAAQARPAQRPANSAPAGRRREPHVS